VYASFLQDPSYTYTHRNHLSARMGLACFVTSAYYLPPLTIHNRFQLSSTVSNRRSQMIRSLFNGSGDAQGRTMGDYYGTCSYGKASLRDVAVVGPIEIPCSATLNLPFAFPGGNNLTTSSCGDNNLLKWMYYMDDQARKQGINPQDYHHKVMILPRNYSLNVAGKCLASGRGLRPP
jgi:hypothetical protein